MNRPWGSPLVLPFLLAPFSLALAFFLLRVGLSAWLAWPLALFAPAVALVVLLTGGALTVGLADGLLRRQLPGVEVRVSRRRPRLLLLAFISSAPARATAAVLARDARASTDLELLHILALARALESS